MHMLDVWQTNIADRKITSDSRGKRLQWEICLPDGTLEEHETRGRKCTNGELRTRAYKTAERIRAEYNSRGGWKRTDKAADYIREVCIPLVDQHPEEGKGKLSVRTKRLYRDVLRYLADEFGNKTIAQICYINVVERALNAIAESHGTSTAIQIRRMCGKWVFTQMMRDGLCDHNIMKETTARIMVSNVVVKKPTGGVALTDDEYDRAMAYMLSADPTLNTKPKSGHGLNEKQRIAKRLAVIDLSLLQATTGLRINEGRNLFPDDCDFETIVIGEREESVLFVTVRRDISKTGRGRRVPVLNRAVADRLRARIEAAKAGRCALFPRVTDHTKLWDPTDCQKAIVRFLREEVGPACGIEAISWPKDEKGNLIPRAELTSEQIPQGSHVWRATLNTRALKRGVWRSQCAAMFGHSEEVNARSYTDESDPSALIEALMQ